MGYAQIDTSAPRNEKLARLSGEAHRVWIHGLCWAQEQKTDGFISIDVLPVLGRPAPRPEWVAELVAGKLWHARHNGYQIHQYTEWNLPRVDRERKAHDNRERQRRFQARVKDANTIESRAVQAALPAPEPGVPEQSRPVSADEIFSRPAPAPGRGNGAIVKPQVAVEKTMANVGYMGTRFRVPLHLHQELIGRYGGTPQDAEKALYRWYGELDDHLDRDASIPNIYTFINGHFADWVKARAASIPAAPAVVKPDDQRIGITPDHAAQIDAAMKRKQQGH